MLTRSNKCFLSSQFLSMIGDGCFHYGIIQLALNLSDGHESFVGRSQLARTLPYFFSLFIAFYIIDHFRRRAVMRVSDILRFVSIGLIAYFFQMSLLTYTLYFSLIVVKSICDVHFQSARDSWVSQIKESESRIKLNSIIQGGSNMGFALGLAFAAGICYFKNEIFSVFGISFITAIFLLDSLSYLISFVLLKFTDNPEVPSGSYSSRSFANWKKLFKKVPMLKTIFIITAIDNLFIMGPAFVGAPMLILKQMEFSEKTGQLYFGIYEVSFSFFMFIASFCIYKKPPKNLLRVFSIGLILDGLTHIPFIFCKGADDYYLLLFFAAIHAFCVPMVMVPRVTWLQNNVPKEMQGRVFASMLAMVLGVTGLSCLITGYLIDKDVKILLASESFSYFGYLAALTGVYSLIVSSKSQSATS